MNSKEGLQDVRKTLLKGLVNLCHFAHNKVTVSLMSEIVVSAPRKLADEYAYSSEIFEKICAAARTNSPPTEQLDEIESFTKALLDADHGKRALIDTFFSGFFFDLQREAILPLMNPNSAMLNPFEPVKPQTFTERQEINIYTDEVIQCIEHGWEAIAAYSSVLLQHRAYAQELITELLGRHPGAVYFIRHEIPIRQAIERLQKDLCSQQDFDEEIYKRIVVMRNDIVKSEGWLAKETYDENDMERYNSLFPQYQELARERISSLLGYTPELRHSLDAEISLRNFFAMMEGIIDDDSKKSVLGIDYQLIHAIKYRELFFTQGQEAADNSPLIKLRKAV